MTHLPRFRRSRAVALVCLGASFLPAFAATRRKQTPAAPTHAVTAIRYWSLGDVTRIAIEATGAFEYDSDRAYKPDRIFFDLRGTTPEIEQRRLSTITVNDTLVREIRVAETRKNVTRVVLDLTNSAEFSTSRLTNPDRLMIEVRRPGTTARRMDMPEPPPPPPTESAAVTPVTRPFAPPEPRQRVIASAPVLQPPSGTTVQSAAGAPLASQALMAKLGPAPVPAYVDRTPRVGSFQQRNAPDISPPAHTSSIARTSPDWPRTTSEIEAHRTLEPDTGSPAKRESDGDRSMIRALGLKVGTIVLDAGHGGHDTGTIGPTGLMEKDLVLDVTQRLGRMIVERLGANVVYTRSDDSFVPLQERTRIANEAHADLFLSIHANSSTLRTASGVETYYLNFTTSKAALDVAARENAGSAMTVGDLQDVIQKIALHDKVDESREFASNIQNALCANSRHADQHSRDRGVRKAPFVVLIGASMPSVLAEIGFVSNNQDERLLRRPDQREKIAEALYRGLSQYAGGLSHFQVAERRTSTESAAR